MTFKEQEQFTKRNAEDVISAFSHLGPILLQTDAAGKDMSDGHQNNRIMKGAGYY